MWHDVETADDLLNYKVLAITAAQMICDADNEPISIGVSGSWGSGKSSLVKMIAAELKQKVDSKEKEFLFLNFNAWLYQGYDDAKSALLQSVADALEKEAKSRSNVCSKVYEFIKRVNWLKIGKLLTPIAISAVTGTSIAGPLGGLLGASKAILDNIKDLKEDQIRNLKDAYSAFSPELSGILEEKAKRSLPQQIDELRKSFMEALDELDITLVVYVDDLDRCLPQTAIATLEAIRLLLFMRRTAFIIAADEQMIRAAVNVHFGGDGFSYDMATSYFDKLIQIPLRIPHPGVNEIKAYIALLLIEKLHKQDKILFQQRKTCEENILTLVRQSWGHAIDLDSLQEACSDIANQAKTSLIIADQIAPTMASAQQIKGNPRLIKRFMNNLEIRESMAKAQKITVGYDVLVKIQLFERCASEAAYNYLVDAVTKSLDGKPEFLRKAEDEYKEGQDYQFEDAYLNIQFIREWARLSPTLGDVDLRPYLYLSRSQSTAFAAYDSLSQEAQDLLEAVQKSDEMNKALSARIQKLSEGECRSILNRLIKKANVNQWPSNLFFGMYYCVQAHAILASEFIDALKTLPPTTRQNALQLIPYIRADANMIPLIENWKNDKYTPGIVQKALSIKK